MTEGPLEAIIPQMQKPRLGDPCNGCGQCCQMSLCPAGVMAFGEAAQLPCPALRHARGRFWCNLVVIEKAHDMEPLISNALGIGLGCSCEDGIE